MEYLLERVRTGEPIDEAAINAGLLRVRPIIMTTATTVLALAPIMLYEISTNTGAELMKPIAVPTFGGMITATAANLILAPVLFSLFYWMENWISRQRRPEDEEGVKKEGSAAAPTGEVVPEETVLAPTDQSTGNNKQETPAKAGFILRLTRLLTNQLTTKSRRREKKEIGRKR